MSLKVCFLGKNDEMQVLLLLAEKVQPDGFTVAIHTKFTSDIKN